MIEARAKLEALIDFSDEDQQAIKTADLVQRTGEQLHLLVRDLEKAVHDLSKCELIREGLRVAICGSPNVGKSSLFNALLRRDAAIVSSVAGTTRDVLEAELLIGGLKVRLFDMAGIRERGECEIENIGIERAREKIKDAHLRIFLTDERNEHCTIDDCIVVHNKSDLHSHGEIRISCLKDDISQLTGLLEEEVERRMGNLEEIQFVTQRRHLQYLQRTITFLSDCVAGLNSDLLLAAECLRLASRELGMITGVEMIGTEEILGSIFSSFCIGK